MKALILSGGNGTRLRPLTYSAAKQLIPVANKPILIHIIEKVAKTGIKEVGIIVGDTHEQIRQAAGSGSKWGINITYIHQPLPLGLAHAVKTAASFLGEDEFLMILGDNLFQMELDGFIHSYKVSGANAHILLYRVKDPSNYGVAVVEKGQITRLVEKPFECISNLIVTGIYIFDKTIHKAIENTVPSGRGELEITDSMQKLLDMGGTISYELAKGWWKDTGKPEDILESNRLIMAGMKTNGNIIFINDCNCTGTVTAGRDVTVKNSRLKGPLAIDDFCYIEGCIIGPYVSIGSNVRIIKCNIKNCVIMDGTTIENIKGEITDSLIGKNVRLRYSDSQPPANSFFIGNNCEIDLYGR
jgi:glucose-1-phosphate thymidylyltransferase